MTDHDRAFLQPRVLIPFIVITLIWGSTWIVIKDQLATVPPTWSVTYRFIIAGAALFAYAGLTGATLRIGREGQGLAALLGILQFFLNYNFVYASEQHITSGLVAVIFALLLVPNSLFAWLFLKHPISGRFLLGSAIAMAGVVLLFIQEIRVSTATTDEVLLGLGLALLAVLCASIANVMQATERMGARPVLVMIAWSMAYGSLANAGAAWLLDGPPVIELRLGYWLGLLYLGLFGSALAFTFYFSIIRAIGPGRAAYSSLLVPIIAMAFSTMFEGYRWSALAMAGGALALIGLFVALRARRIG